MKLYKHAKLQEAFDRFARQQNALLPDEETIATVTLSENFKERMRKMLNRQKCGFFVLFGTAGRRVASILITLLVAATVTTASVEALREPVVQFFTEVFEKFTQILFVDDTPKTPQAELEKRAPAYIPEGYTVETEMDLITMYQIVYSNDTNKRINYTQHSKQNMEVQADTEGVQYTDIMIGNRQGVTYSNKEFVYIIISDDKYSYIVSGNILINELIKMAESLIF